mmetsp:Transcript_25798/g.75609  ORF Transcript_25798/g.75609 Transcript_25798/m.75609 type:complete len:312 (+) Transcript_25798:373-1308(+)
MPMVAATRGTLSTMAEATPMIAATTSVLGTAAERLVASSLSSPDASSAPMAMRTPRKNKMPLVSSRLRAAGTCRADRFSSACRASVTTQSAPRPVSMPMKGGRPVFSTNTGTERSAPSPTPSTSPESSGALSNGGRAATRAPSSGAAVGASWSWSTAMEATTLTREQASRSVTVCKVDSWPFIHSMVVVTSPMGVQTPPALAAMTTMAPKSLRSSLSSMTLRSRLTMTIVTVRLLSTAERKKVIKPTSQNSFWRESTCSFSVRKRKPWCASITSTMVLAARRKKQMSDTSARCCDSCPSSVARSPMPENSM